MKEAAFLLGSVAIEQKAKKNIAFAFAFAWCGLTIKRRHFRARISLGLGRPQIAISQCQENPSHLKDLQFVYC